MRRKKSGTTGMTTKDDVLTELFRVIVKHESATMRIK